MSTEQTKHTPDERTQQRVRAHEWLNERAQHFAEDLRDGRFLHMAVNCMCAFSESEQSALLTRVEELEAENKRLKEEQDRAYKEGYDTRNNEMAGLYKERGRLTDKVNSQAQEIERLKEQLAIQTGISKTHSETIAAKDRELSELRGAQSLGRTRRG